MILFSVVASCVQSQRNSTAHSWENSLQCQVVQQSVPSHGNIYLGNAICVISVSFSSQFVLGGGGREIAVYVLCHQLQVDNQRVGQKDQLCLKVRAAFLSSVSYVGDSIADDQSGVREPLERSQRLVRLTNHKLNKSPFKLKSTKVQTLGAYHSTTNCVHIYTIIIILK